MKQLHYLLSYLVEVPLPPDSQGIILLNIDSYSGGVPMWANGVKNGNALTHGLEHSTSDLNR
ncbi:MAG: hypothetical protein KTR30_12120, partial [Saprospiraceae bacterium]|nr:hypothetical protein [Saprospiraceae bacterium]